MPLLVHKDKKLFFIHIPKTGGSSLYLGNLQPQGVGVEFFGRSDHCTRQHYQLSLLDEFFPEYRDCCPFTMIREPWKRTCSEFIWANKRNPSWDRFNSWLGDALDRFKNKPYHLDNHLRPQHEFVADHVKIFVQDRYHEMQEFVESQFGTKFDWSVREKVGNYSSQDISILDKEVGKKWWDLYGPDVDLYKKFL